MLSNMSNHSARLLTILFFLFNVISAVPPHAPFCAYQTLDPDSTENPESHVSWSSFVPTKEHRISTLPMPNIPNIPSQDSGKCDEVKAVLMQSNCQASEAECKLVNDGIVISVNSVGVDCMKSILEKDIGTKQCRNMT